jgi:hypothetical protein
VGIELCLKIIGILELGIASLAHAYGQRGLFYDPQFALRHDCSRGLCGGYSVLMVSVLSPVKEIKPDEYKHVTEVTYLGRCIPHSRSF